MKQFFKFMFATIVGLLVTFFLVIVIIGGVVGSIAASSSSSKKDVFVPKNSVLHVKLDHMIKDRAPDNPFENFDFETFEPKKNLSLRSIVTSIEKAKTDDRIEGIYLDLSFINTGLGSIEEIREALEEFKTSGKWIISYAEVYTQRSYYLASVADKIYLNPAGFMELRGLASQLMFFKNALKKLDIDFQIIRHGKFKSAVEPFMLDKMSDENRAQLSKILNSIWGSMLNKISSSRNISFSDINQLADDVTIRDAESAVKYNFVDQLKYKDEILAELRDSLELEENADIKSLSLGKYALAKPAEKETGKELNREKIALIYAEGSIESGKSKEGSMGSETISKAIREARLDEDVKAIVLRVNSPGGSALASDVMWREMTLAKQAKPVVVSMGDVAASGGYYIACAANKIVASEKTITGSIGVFGVIPNTKGFFNNKLGITFDTVKTNTHSDMMTVVRPLTGEEKAIIQTGVEKIYDDFITKVAEGRNMTKEQVDEIGQGRVWTGSDAKEIGLVDEIGGVERSIELAQEMANVENYEIIDYPKKKDPFQLLLDFSSNAQTSWMKKQLGENFKYYEKLEAVKNQTGVLMLMPFDVDIY